MLKSILKINGVKSLTRSNLKRVSGGKMRGTDCSVVFAACDEQHPTNDNKFEKCLNYSGCGPAF
ncbi:hypothetical protein IWQ47_000202 [Aquimarina sp. EL_43]|uniref:Bacteriocin n=1 Tax=Aquimarina atlantica TaxID=1317122 RepID=A0A023BVZ8_9FLAO|nr:MULTISPECIES: hypothetical protein [Aquimarina]EZH74212.1 hypothetical protein ATO12_15205 [Aquimarina atlantica]MBG6129106.1 hypothetical protein [Aquimarina sp. EL_35]MBG6150171.1 hypothetical protein [Aquimarina sp. EL_32]MBG6167144.1 hypothetical protein [Aquimarina sp. EL_43]